MIRTVAIEGYRSIESLVLHLDALTVVTGGNGTGKSNLYRALKLLAECGTGRMIPALAASGGLDSVRFAGDDRRPEPVSLRLGFAGETLGYAVDIGVAQPAETLFRLDPVIKQEHVFSGDMLRPASTLIERKNALAKSDGVTVQRSLAPWQSVLDEQPGNDAVPEAGAIRRQLRSWRFHDAFRTDASSPARRPQVATRTFSLDDDGADLAAVLQTTRENGGDWELAEATIAEALEGSVFEMLGDADGLTVGLRQPGMRRAITAAEMSDGTLQLLLLVACLTAAEKPGLLVLNEPERSLHASLMPALGGLIAATSETTQTIVVTHQSELVRHLGGTHIELTKHGAATTVVGREGPLDQPPWSWPKR